MLINIQNLQDIIKIGTASMYVIAVVSITWAQRGHYSCLSPLNSSPLRSTVSRYLEEEGKVEHELKDISEIKQHCRMGFCPRVAHTLKKLP